MRSLALTRPLLPAVVFARSGSAAIPPPIPSSLARQSGQWEGQSFIRSGRANAAARFNPDLKAKYQQLIVSGKPAKLAITALMRKLIVIANTLFKADRPWVKAFA